MKETRPLKKKASPPSQFHLHSDQDGDNLLARIDERLKNLIENQELIYLEVKKTNGRVTVLENWSSKIKGSYSAIIVVCSFFAFATGIIFTYFSLISK